jgi:hypothetical protein
MNHAAVVSVGCRQYSTAPADQLLLATLNTYKDPVCEVVCDDRKQGTASPLFGPKQNKRREYRYGERNKVKVKTVSIIEAMRQSEKQRRR